MIQSHISCFRKIAADDQAQFQQLLSQRECYASPVRWPGYSSGLSLGRKMKVPHCLLFDVDSEIVRQLW